MANNPRPRRSGTIFRYQPAKPGEAHGHYVVRCSAPDGTRPLFHLDPAAESPKARASALRSAEAITERLFAQGMGAAPPTRERARRAKADDGSTCDRWFAAWISERRARGFTSTRDNEGHYREHIEPVIGDRHIKLWVPDDLRGLSRALDRKVREGSISAKTAQNIWGTATKMCDDAAESKDDDIKCRADNPAAGVRGPDRGIEPEPQFLFPSEFAQFAACKDVPLRWRRLVAVAIYTYARDAELRVLDCSDVDLERGTIRITKALDKRVRPPQPKPTKGKRNRVVPIEPAVAPLVRALSAEREGTGRLVNILFPSERDMARGLRRWLLKAGVTRPALHNDTQTTAKLRFHDLRATGITWMAVRGDDALKIQRRAGHQDLETTQRYIRLAEDFSAGFGEVFPELPEELVSGGQALSTSPPASAPVTGAATGGGNHRESLRGGRDSNPRPPA